MLHVSKERQVQLINKITLKHLNKSLGLVDWQDVISMEDTDMATDNFLRNFKICLLVAHELRKKFAEKNFL